LTGTHKNLDGGGSVRGVRFRTVTALQLIHESEMKKGFSEGSYMTISTVVSKKWSAKKQSR